MLRNSIFKTVCYYVISHCHRQFTTLQSCYWQWHQPEIKQQLSFSNTFYKRLFFDLWKTIKIGVYICTQEMSRGMFLLTLNLWGESEMLTVNLKSVCPCFKLTHQGTTLRGSADKSLAWPTSRCCRMESIVSLERGVCLCAELQVFSCYRGWKGAWEVMHAISTTWRHELSSSFFFLQGKALKEIHAILTKTLGEHASSYATIKNWVAQFKPGDFSTCDAPCPGQLKNSDHPGDYWSNSWTNLGRPLDFG